MYCQISLKFVTEETQFLIYEVNCYCNSDNLALPLSLRRTAVYTFTLDVAHVKIEEINTQNTVFDNDRTSKIKVSKCNIFYFQGIN
jgi:hypothetical protein